MRIFEGTEKGWGNKINFVDDNNVFVGFDFDQNCCEDFGTLVTKEIPESGTYFSDYETGDVDHEGYNFDVDFQKCLNGPEYDDGGAVVFRLTKEGHDDIYLVLYNHHNGYYSHGFTMKTENRVIYDDWI